MHDHVRRELLEDRLAAVRSRGFGLTEAEAAILASVPQARLELMIERIRPEKHGKRRFMKAVAMAVVTLATGTAGVACEGEGNPDDAGDVPVDSPQIDVTGDMSDIPDFLDIDLEDPPDMEAEGTGPDIPPDLPPDDEEGELEGDADDEDAPEDEGEVG